DQPSEDKVQQPMITDIETSSLDPLQVDTSSGVIPESPSASSMSPLGEFSPTSSLGSMVQERMEYKSSFGPLQVDTSCRTGLGALANKPGFSSLQNEGFSDDSHFDPSRSTSGRSSDPPTSPSTFLDQPSPDEHDRKIQKLIVDSCLAAMPNKEGIVDPVAIRNQLEAVRRHMKAMEEAGPASHSSFSSP
ncbi:hypothetical protein PMAYCL1PPCAC_14324, partial [Pristionchus mayeri]